METQCSVLDRIMPLVGKHWGFEELRPLQRESMEAILAGRDSVVVLPTGSGKSLCYQAPALLGRRATLVVSPLISLMKDQVDALNQRGIASAVLNSSLTPEHRAEVVQGIRSGSYRLVYVAPERFRQPDFVDLIAECEIRNFIIDEAHCVSHWGHEFREDYLRLDLIKRRFPHAAVHAFTATATRRVRDDIALRLGLSDPLTLVASVDRPNLCYRVVPRHDALSQMVEIIERHKGEAGLIYCLRRNDTEAYAADLQNRGYRAVPYHAGMTAEQRYNNQTAFASEKADIVVATVAFGMGIDRSNVRYIIHAHMPKSIEHYQQEVGRAGRDGLEAECVLLHSAGDVVKWQRILENADTEDEIQRAHIQERVESMHSFSITPRCRHAMIVEHFEQEYESDNCGACDICLGEVATIDDADTIARKILSCVARVGWPTFGVGHIADILCGSKSAKIVARGHDRLSTHGLLAEHEKREVRSWIDQLVGQEYLRRSDAPYHTLELTDSAWRVMRGESSALLTRPRGEMKVSKTAAVSWEGVDAGLFEALRTWRRERAAQEDVPASVVFSDAVLRTLAACRPGNVDALNGISGIGQHKTTNYGTDVIAQIDEYCAAHSLARDIVPRHEARDAPHDASKSARRGKPVNSPAARRAREMFAKGASVERVAADIERATSTVWGYLTSYVSIAKPESLRPWVTLEEENDIVEASTELKMRRLAPIFEKLEGRVPYEHIRLVLAHRYADTPHEATTAAV